VKVAVLGAGLTGALVALELAEAGHEVMLFDRQAQPFSGASLACEGKIHLGYVYALDQSRRTAMRMLRGAAVFRPLIARWTGEDLFHRALSEPFLYAVPRDSLLPVEAIEAHFRAIAKAARQMPAGPAPGPDGRLDWEALPRAVYGQTFDPDHVAAVLRTEERAMDTAELSGAIRAALAAAPRVILRMGCQIDRVSAAEGGYRVEGREGDAALAESFPVVVNALWENRVHIDATLGLPAGRDLVHRFKFGLFTRAPEKLQAVPNVTFLIGAYGDAVRFATNAYLSWYPVGLVSQEIGVRPGRQEHLPEDARAEEIVTGTLANLARLMPGAAAALRPEAADWVLKGGFITAWGKTGIEDATSELHERHDVGVFSHGDYHSIDTGKLTLAPQFATEACARILARHGRAG
jgi:glycine/D-amino acid oxidase-like deaminating enzyme